MLRFVYFIAFAYFGLSLFYLFTSCFACPFVEVNGGVVYNAFDKYACVGV